MAKKKVKNMMEEKSEKGGKIGKAKKGKVKGKY